MIKVLFVCWGNICRSPMCEFVLKDMVEKRGISNDFHIESAATSTEEIGNPVYPPAKAELARHGIGCA
ncbi:MAG: low molecular weight phosphotyrosine protein phosphatase, partial [Lachnospiraceae bacterium]|nr:low molecular weight phosphotyrosine protein phosphatase [Lachnospiraceae bacterium]